MKSLSLALACSCLLVAAGPSWSMEETPSSAPLQSSSGNGVLESEIEPEVEQLRGGPGKRAYTYVSEYKRLPIYNFGLGKRWGSNNNNNNNNVDEDKVRPVPRYRSSCSSSGACNPFFQRARLYSFGLGKRARPYSFGLGKRAGDETDDYETPLDDLYLQEKRSRLYSFGLGKRLGGDERGDFGQRFNFGLGKRPSEDFGHRYKFGLGKRRARIDDEDDDEDLEQTLTS